MGTVNTSTKPAPTRTRADLAAARPSALAGIRCRIAVIATVTARRKPGR